MKNFLGYSLGVLSWLLMPMASAVEKFEVLPDLPDPLAYAVQPAQAATVTGSADMSLLGAQSIGKEPSMISVVLSLVFVILIIYVIAIAYEKLNKVGFKTLRRYQGEFSRSHVSVISTTQLGNNKTLHVVELDGKRMLIGASSGAIQLIKDLGNYSSNCLDEDFSHIEIPNIKIPKIEIPKIEIPAINFSKLVTKTHKPIEEIEEEHSKEEVQEQKIDSINQVENPEGIIDSLFAQQDEPIVTEEEKTKSEHIVDPDDYALYRKYLG